MAAHAAAVGRRVRRIQAGHARLCFIENWRAWCAHSGRVDVITRPLARVYRYADK